MDFNDLSFIVRSLGDKWHRIALRVQPGVEICTTLRDTTYTGIAVQAVVTVLFVGNSGARARVQTVRMRIIVPTWGLKHVAMPVDSGDGKGAESQDNLIEKRKLHVGSVSRSTRDQCYESGSLSR
jgi:hypothetical protein